jgi:hypothetical protein
MIYIYIYVPHAFHTSMITMYEKHDDVLIGSSMLFVCSVVRVKSIRVEWDVD